jgi:hypothetical protein
MHEKWAQRRRKRQKGFRNSDIVSNMAATSSLVCVIVDGRDEEEMKCRGKVVAAGTGRHW